MSRKLIQTSGLSLVLALAAAACDEPMSTAPGGGAGNPAPQMSVHEGAPYTFGAAVFDIAASPDGGLLVAENTTIHAIRGGGITTIGTVPTVPGSPVNGIVAMGAGSYLVTSGGLDQAEGAGLWHVTRGQARLVADIAAFERRESPDAFGGPRWKDQRCEEDPSQGFTAGPQSNPYHLTRLTGGTALVADAAGNSLLSAGINGAVDWVAVFTPPTDDDGEYLVFFPLEDGTDCFVQPVPTAVAIGPGGDYYVGELTGLTPAELGGAVAPALSRVWRIRAGARNVTCPSEACEVLVSGLTSVIDVAFGPDGLLYVVEMDANGWFAAAVLGNEAGGRISRCDPATAACELVADGLVLPGAITFDAGGRAWVLENGTREPTVRLLELP